MRSIASLLLGALALAGVAAPQTLPKDEELKRYRKQLEPGLAVEARIEAMKNVAFFDVVPTTKLLIDALAATLKRIEELEGKRATIDDRIDKILKAPIEKGGPGAKPDYSGVAELQVAQKAVGEQITTEERAVRGFVDALARLKRAESLDFLMAQRPRKPARLFLTLIDAMGRIDDGRVAEHLIALLGEETFEVRTAAAAALLRQKPEFVPAESFAPLLRGSDWQERSLAIDALARLGGRDAVEMLIVQTSKEEGRMLGDLCGRLEQLTGQKLGKTPAAWVDWWQKAKGGWEQRGIDLSQPAQVIKDAGRYGTFFKVKFDSLRVVFVIDISGSMLAAVDDFENLHPAPGKSRIDLARREVKASINGLSPESSFNLIAYSDVVLPWRDRNVPASAENRKQAFAWLDGLGAVGQTNIFDALDTAFHLAPQSSKDKYYASNGDTILFMSDGGPTCGRTTDCDEIRRQVADWNRTRRITIHTVGIGKQVVESFLKGLATASGGQYVLIDK